jgi:dTDP-4-amino-4,6-dideoxygalactose transaminase
MSDLRVPLLDLKPQYAQIRKQIDEAIRRVVGSQHFVLGPEVEALEEEIASYCGTRFAVGCASGSDAILLALMVHGIGPGDEVICPTYTFFSTAGSISRLGATPVFADIDPRTFNATGESLLAAAKRCTRLKAIIPVHLFGQAAPMAEILALGQELGVPIIEDAAQAIGARDTDGQRVGSRGHIGCFSFYPSKNLGGYGDGGIVTTNDESLAERLRALREHGAKPKHHHPIVGLGSRLDALQAAVLRVKLAHLDAWSARRRDNAATYDELFTEAGAGAGPGDPGASVLPVRIPVPDRAPALHIFNQYVIRVPAQLRDPLLEYLRQHDVGAEVYYRVPLHLQECFRPLGLAPGDLPVSERAARETLALPIFPELTGEQIRTVVHRVQAFFTGDRTSR